MTTDAQWGQRLKGMSTEDVMHAALQAIDELQRRGADASATTLARASVATAALGKPAPRTELQRTKPDVLQAIRRHLDQIQTLGGEGWQRLAPDHPSGTPAAD